MKKLELAESFARDKHSKLLGLDGKPYSTHLENVVNRLKSLGITDEDVLCSAWLYDVINLNRASFNDVFERFGRKIAINVSSLTKDHTLSKKDRELNFVKQLQDAAFEVKLIKLCDISANLRELDCSTLSKTSKIKQIKQRRHYLNVIKKGLSDNGSNLVGIQRIFDGLNQILTKYSQKPVMLQVVKTQ